jgi:hypothetical protein
VENHPNGRNDFPKEVEKIIQLDETIFLKKWEKSCNWMKIFSLRSGNKIIQLDGNIFIKK